MVPFDKLRAGSAHHKDLTPMIKHLFWWVPEKEIARPLHNYIKSAIMSYRRRPVSSIIKHFLDSGFHRNDE